MFFQAAAFNQPLSFDASKVTTMEFMFWGAEAFNQDLVILENISTSSGHTICLKILDAVTRAIPSVQMDLGVLLQLVQIPRGSVKRKAKRK